MNTLNDYTKIAISHIGGSWHVEERRTNGTILVRSTHDTRQAAREAKKTTTPLDFTVQNEGTIFLLFPVTTRAHTWVTEHLPEDRQTFGEATAIEHRYIEDIVNGIRNDGLTVE